MKGEETGRLPSQPFIVEGAFAGGTAGLFLLFGYAINAATEAVAGIVFAKSLILTAHVILVFTLFAIYSVQAEKSGAIGRAGMILAELGTVLVSANLLVEIVALSGLQFERIVNAPLLVIVDTVGPSAFGLGVLFLGVATMITGSLPRVAGALLVLGTIIFATTLFTPRMIGWFSAIGAALTGVGFSIAGVALFAKRGAVLPEENQPQL